MDFNDLIPLLGQSPDHPKLRAHFQQTGVTKQPKPKADEGMDYVQYPDDGYELRFDLAPDGVKIFLSSVTAFPAGDATHKPFTGTLPHGVDAGAHRDDLVAKFGEPATHNKIFKSDQWKYADHNLVVGYDKETLRVKRVHITLPGK